MRYTNYICFFSFNASSVNEHSILQTKLLTSSLFMLYVLVKIVLQMFKQKNIHWTLHWIWMVNALFITLADFFFFCTSLCSGCRQSILKTIFAWFNFSVFPFVLSTVFLLQFFFLFLTGTPIDSLGIHLHRETFEGKEKAKKVPGQNILKMLPFVLSLPLKLRVLPATVTLTLTH